MLRVLHDTKFNFMGSRKLAYFFSSFILLAGLVSLVIKGGPKPGIDFAGGTMLELRFSQNISSEELRRAADESGLVGAEIQTYEGTNDALFRLQKAVEQGTSASGEAIVGPSIRIQQALASRHAGLTVEILRQEVVGPKVGRELTQKAFMAILVSVLAIMIYVTLRFHRWEFGLGAALALLHDILVTLGIFSILDKEIGLTVLAAFLTIAGFSINDTIVVFDRVRENLEKHRKVPLFDLMNDSINQTLSRTILTVMTVMMTAAALYFLGGEVIHDFALAMLIGVGFGTYSSVFVASALSLDIDAWRRRKDAARAASKAAEKVLETKLSGARKTGKSSPTVSAR